MEKGLGGGNDWKKLVRREREPPHQTETLHQYTHEVQSCAICAYAALAYNAYTHEVQSCSVCAYAALAYNALHVAYTEIWWGIKFGGFR